MTTTYYWLLIEGIQLFCLLVATVMSVKKYFYTYMTFGWGMSWVSVLTWAICKKKYENQGCWEIHNHRFYEMIIRLPILLSIIVRFIEKNYLHTNLGKFRDLCNFGLRYCVKVARR